MARAPRSGSIAIEPGRKCLGELMGLQTYRRRHPMTRTRILFSQRRFQLLATLTALLLAVGVVIASSASFTAKSANAENVFQAGELAMENTQSGMSTEIAQMVPGDWHEGTVKIENTGNVQGQFFLEPVTIAADSMDGKFSEKLQLTVSEGGKELYSGSLSGLKKSIDLGIWEVKEAHEYTFNVAFPDAGRDDAGNGLDNEFMDAYTSADFDWTAVSVSQGQL
jgi:hypothetical protein